MSRKRHENVMSSVLNGKGLPLRLHCCHRKLVCQATGLLQNDLHGAQYEDHFATALCQTIRMLDLNDLTWYAFDNRGFSLLWNTSRFSGA